MSARPATMPIAAFVGELFERAEQRRGWTWLGWGVAICGHALAASLAIGERSVEAPLPPPLEIELAQPEPPPPEPAAPIAAPAPLQSPEPAQAKAAAPPPEPARAAALLTAKADPSPTPNADEPVDFTNDPGVLGFGSGVVAVGGKADVGLKHAALGGAPVAATVPAKGPTGDGLTAVGDLSKKPSLGESDPCRGYFPSAASDDVASAAVLVTIGKTGSVSNVRLLSETPPKQGFGSAARACMASKRFTPGLDRDGQPAATAIRVNIRFSR